MGIVHEDEDVVQHFIQAVKIDWSFLHRIKSDRLCQEHPEILKRISQEIIIMEPKKENTSNS